MRWILLGLVSLLLSACLFVEGQIIEEPKDVVVGNTTAKYASWEQYATVDVSEKAER